MVQTLRTSGGSIRSIQGHVVVVACMHAFELSTSQLFRHCEHARCAESQFRDPTLSQYAVSHLCRMSLKANCHRPCLPELNAFRSERAYCCVGVFPRQRTAVPILISVRNILLDTCTFAARCMLSTCRMRHQEVDVDLTGGSISSVTIQIIQVGCGGSTSTWSLVRYIRPYVDWPL